MNFKEEFSERVAQAQAIVYDYLPKSEGYPKTIIDAIHYSVEAGGKRIRPVIMKATYELCGGDKSSCINPFMAAIEMIHTYSLVHDDLPAMDNDDYRRGKLTTHKKFGEDMGVLAGDALLNLAFETAFEAFDSDVDKSYVADALKVLGRKAGIYGMVGGQVVDVEENGKFVDEQTLMYVYENKTSALLESCFMIGGILAGATKDEIHLLEQAGNNLGIAFQIQDDILDMVGDEQKLGKPVHSDEKNEKSTYAAMHGIEQSKAKVSEYTNRAVECLSSFDGDKHFLKELMLWMIDRDK